MTQEEVDLIYNYLHENFFYEYGELKKIKDGLFVGFVQTSRSNSSYIMASLTINKKKYHKALSHFIWIFFNKTAPKIIGYKDDNSMNTKIENIINFSSRSQAATKISKRNSGAFLSSPLSKKPYFVQIMIERKAIHLASCATKEEAENIYKDAKLLAHKGITSNLELKKRLKEIYPHAIAKTKSNKSGFKGVICAPNNKFQANIRVKNKTIYLGTYNNALAAHEAYLNAKKALRDK